MLYNDLHQYFGNHIAKRVQAQLSRSEFSQIDIKDLPEYLEMRAEAAHKEYQIYLDNPFGDSRPQASRKTEIDALYRRWREAEDLAYLIAVAEDVSHNATLVAVAGR